MKINYVTGLLTVALSLPTFAGQVYVGANVGQAQFKKATISVSSIGSSSVSLNKSSFGGELLAGYKFNDYLSIESSFGGYDAIDGNNASLGDMVYFAVQPKISFPLNQMFSIYGKAGVSRFSAKGYYYYEQIKASAITPKYSMGGEAKISKNLRLNAHLDYMAPEFKDNIQGHDVKLKMDIMTLMVGVNYHF